MRAGALRSALSLRAKEGNLVVVRDLTLPEVKTKALNAILGKLEVSSALLVDTDNRNLLLSSRNIPSASFLETRGVNVYDILRFPKLVISESSLREVESRLSRGGKGDAQ